MSYQTIRHALAVFFALSLSCFITGAVFAQGEEAQIRKNLKERMPQIQPIDEVRRTPMPGLFEVRVDGTDIYYTDASGHFLLQGQLIDTRNQRNLTEERLQKIMAIDFKSLPFKDAISWVKGNGERKIAVFEDPNCGYCKRFERDIAKLDNVTVFVFLYPILGKDSVEKSKSIWCAKDPAKSWQDWMVRDQMPAAANCDTGSLKRNMEYGQKMKITGTPTTLLPDGTRIPGAIELSQLEKLLAKQ
ncbi:MAG: DsbC family protein [Methylotenera sp.]|nr:DsbC family protein [Methylotenera sp.]